MFGVFVSPPTLSMRFVCSLPLSVCFVCPTPLFVHFVSPPLCLCILLAPFLCSCILLALPPVREFCLSPPLLVFCLSSPVHTSHLSPLLMHFCDNGTPGCQDTGTMDGVCCPLPTYRNCGVIFRIIHNDASSKIYLND